MSADETAESLQESGFAATEEQVQEAQEERDQPDEQTGGAAGGDTAPERQNVPYRDAVGLTQSGFAVDEARVQDPDPQFTQPAYGGGIGEQAAEFEQRVIEEVAAADDPSDVRITRDGDRLRARLTAQARQEAQRGFIQGRGFGAIGAVSEREQERQRILAARERLAEQRQEPTTEPTFDLTGAEEVTTEERVVPARGDVTEDVVRAFEAETDIGVREPGEEPPDLTANIPILSGIGSQLEMAGEGIQQEIIDPTAQTVGPTLGRISAPGLALTAVEAGGDVAGVDTGIDAAQFSREFGTGAVSGGLGILNAPAVGASVIDAAEFGLAGTQAQLGGRGEEFGEQAAGEGALLAGRLAQEAATSPTEFTGMLAGGLATSAGTIGATRAIGGARAGRAAAFGIQPGEELLIAAGRRAPGVQRATRYVPGDVGRVARAEDTPSGPGVTTRARQAIGERTPDVRAEITERRGSTPFEVNVRGGLPDVRGRLPEFETGRFVQDVGTRGPALSEVLPASRTIETPDVAGRIADFRTQVAREIQSREIQAELARQNVQERIGDVQERLGRLRERAEQVRAGRGVEAEVVPPRTEPDVDPDAIENLLGGEASDPPDMITPSETGRLFDQEPTFGTLERAQIEAAIVGARARDVARGIRQRATRAPARLELGLEDLVRESQRATAPRAEIEFRDEPEPFFDPEQAPRLFNLPESGPRFELPSLPDPRGQQLRIDIGQPDRPPMRVTGDVPEGRNPLDLLDEEFEPLDLPRQEIPDDTSDVRPTIREREVETESGVAVQRVVEGPERETRVETDPNTRIRPGFELDLEVSPELGTVPEQPVDVTEVPTPDTELFEVPRIDLDTRIEPRQEPRLEPRLETRQELRVEPRQELRQEPRLEARVEPRTETRTELNPDIEPPDQDDDGFDALFGGEAAPVLAQFRDPLTGEIIDDG